MKNEKIINAWNEIRSSDETKNEIFNKITQKQKRKRPGLKKIAVIAAVMSVVFILSGAAAVYYEMITYDMNGNVSHPNIPFYNSTMYDTGTEEYEFEFELRNSKEDNEIILIHYPEQTRCITFPAYKTITDYGELKEYLQNNGGEELKLPEYIPAGFEFENANVYVGLSGNADYEELEPVYYEEKFGNVYEKYLLPEDKTHAERADIYYSNGKIKINCNIRFLTGDIDGISFGSSMPVNTEPEVLDIPQFEKSLIMSYKNGVLNPNPMWIVRAVKNIDNPVNISDATFVSKTYRERRNGLSLKDFKVWEAVAVGYTIESWATAFSKVSYSEMIKIAESIPK